MESADASRTGSTAQTPGHAHQLTYVRVHLKPERLMCQWRLSVGLDMPKHVPLSHRAFRGFREKSPTQPNCIPNQPQTSNPPSETANFPSELQTKFRAGIRLICPLGLGFLSFCGYSDPAGCYRVKPKSPGFFCGDPRSLPRTMPKCPTLCSTGSARQ
ncbi:hypothetical protein MHYP_G00217540 [Metynnis hypsauchen]